MEHNGAHGFWLSDVLQADAVGNSLPQKSSKTVVASPSATSAGRATSAASPSAVRAGAVLALAAAANAKLAPISSRVGAVRAPAPAASKALATYGGGYNEWARRRVANSW